MKAAEELLLIPTPRRLINRDGPPFVIPSRLTYQGPLHSAAERLVNAAIVNTNANVSATIEVGASRHDQGYALSIRADGITLRASSSAGVRHALVTLGQLIRGVAPANRIPALDIEDSPTIAVRGVMLDISRDKVPTMASLKDVIDAFEHLKINHLQLYTEHTFAYRGHEEIWRDSSPITPDEARELEAYCRERGIELAPNQNTLGHLHRWLNHPKYAALAELHGDWEFQTDDGRRIPRHGPFSLCPIDPRSIELVRDMLDQLLPCFASGMCNIGLDEAYDVGQGRSRDEVARRGKGEVFFEHLNRVNDIVRAHGKRSLFWADIALKHEGLLDRLPRGAEALVWGYEGDAPFDRQGAQLRAMGVPFWTCPGTSSWLTTTGRTSVRRANIDAAVRAAATHGAEGVLVTEWGDRGHRQHWPIALQSIAYGASAMWRADAPETFDARAATVHALGAAAELGPLLEELGDADAGVRGHLRNTSAVFSEMHRSIGAPLDSVPASYSEQSWREVRDALSSLEHRFGAMRSSLPGLVADELAHTFRTALLGVAKIRGRLQGGPLAREMLAKLAGEASAIRDEHRRLWVLRNRPGGLDDSARHLGEIIEDLERR